jgi:hypothetical protein
MRESWLTKRFWFNYAARKPFDVDVLFDNFLNEAGAGVESLDEEARAGLEPFVQMKMKQLRRVPLPDIFEGDSHQLPLFLYQVKLYLLQNAMAEDEKVFFAMGFLRGRAFACFERYLGDYLSNDEGERKQDTDEMFGGFQVFEDRLRLLFRTRVGAA